MVSLHTRRHEFQCYSFYKRPNRSHLPKDSSIGTYGHGQQYITSDGRRFRSQLRDLMDQRELVVHKIAQACVNVRTPGRARARDGVSRDMLETATG